MIRVLKWIAAAATTVLLCSGCEFDDAGLPQYQRKLILLADDADGAVMMRACALWSALADCRQVAAGEETARLFRRAPEAGSYARCCTDGVIEIDDALIAERGLTEDFVIAHEFGHLAGIHGHIAGPALMAEDASVTWGRAELGALDRAAIERITAPRDLVIVGAQ